MGWLSEGHAAAREARGLLPGVLGRGGGIAVCVCGCGGEFCELYPFSCLEKEGRKGRMGLEGLHGKGEAVREG